MGFRKWLHRLLCRHERGFFARLHTIEPDSQRKGVLTLWACHDCGKVINRGHVSWKAGA